MTFIEEHKLPKVEQQNILRRMAKLKQNEVRVWAAQKRLAWAVRHNKRNIGLMGYYVYGGFYEVFANFWEPPSPLHIRAITRGLALMPRDKQKLARVRKDNLAMQKVITKIGFKKWMDVENYIVYREAPQWQAKQ